MKPSKEPGLGPTSPLISQRALVTTQEHLEWRALPDCQVSELGSPEANSETRAQVQGVNPGGSEKISRGYRKEENQ